MFDLLLLASLAQPECLVSERKMTHLVAESRKVENKHNLPRGLMMAVVLAESGGRKVVGYFRGENKTGCDVGEAQIHVKKCKRDRMQRLLVLSTNLDVGAKLLSESRKKCELHPRWAACKRGEFALYNEKSKSWWGRVKNIWQNIEEKENEKLLSMRGDR